MRRFQSGWGDGAGEDGWVLLNFETHKSIATPKITFAMFYTFFSLRF